jgi:hypothetical protein
MPLYVYTVVARFRNCINACSSLERKKNEVGRQMAYNRFSTYTIYLPQISSPGYFKDADFFSHFLRNQMPFSFPPKEDMKEGKL